MLQTCRNKGFQMTFANGWTVSVQWGPGNYVGLYPEAVYSYDAPEKQPNWQSANAEVAAWDSHQKWYVFKDDGDKVKGFQSPDEVARFVSKVSKFKRK